MFLSPPVEGMGTQLLFSIIFILCLMFDAICRTPYWEKLRLFFWKSFLIFMIICSEYVYQKGRESKGRDVRQPNNQLDHGKSKNAVVG